MDGPSHTSFIPRKSISSPTLSGERKVPLLTLVSIIILIAAVALSAGVFIYKGILENGIASKKTSLERARSAFDPVLIETLKRLDRRLTTSRTLLRDHIALSVLFDTLERTTSENIRYNTFNWNGQDPKKFTLSMNGEAQSYASVAFQSDALAKSLLVRDPVFSDLTLDQRGRIVFTLNASVDREGLKFERTLLEENENNEVSEN